ncbi:ubiquitin-like protein [Exidia glandulosa HHB12029]|uniref:Ubiquitin-like protein n=1 Tax=Exidia glandulosa HHB12029 TaxID=1314781 RepID=A0A165I7C4_EXIGL|nr:ubiquitin-like protein [Exidia glandulosa HHB12029]
MADLELVTQHIALLAHSSQHRPNDHQLPLSQWPRKVPLLGIDLPPPPERKNDAQVSAAQDITLTVKSLKPALTFTLAVQPTDSIQHIKAKLAAQPNAPPADSQRLLYKGKALADARLLKEYDIPQASTLNLVIKPGTTMPAPEQTHTRAAPSLDVHPPPPEPASPSLIPQVILSPTPAPARDGSRSPHRRTQSLTPVSLSLDGDTSFAAASDPPHHASTAPTTYHSTITSPEFWKKLHDFLQKEFTTREDASSAFEEFLVASKGELSITDIAKIRDTVGEFGMGGT